MKYNLNLKSLYLILLIGVILHFIYILQFDDYYDDWNFFYTVYPYISDSDTWIRHYFGDRGDGTILKEAFPWNFTYLTKYFLKIAGYTVENVHYFLIIFTTLSFLVFYKLCNLISESYRFKLLALIFLVTNLFLIRELNAFRPHSLSILLSLLSNYFFIVVYIKNRNEKRFILFYIISSILMLSFWPQNLSLYFGHCVCFLILCFKKKKFIFHVMPASTIFLMYALLNYDYIKYIAFQDWSYTQFNIKFFFSYFFGSFFGSNILGGLILIIFSIYLIKEVVTNLKKSSLSKMPIFNLNSEKFLIINIITIYFIMILYSILKESVLAPKYFLVLIPLIILWLSLKLSKIKSLYYNVILVSLVLNTFYYWNDVPIKKPPMRDLLKIIKNQNIKKVYTTERIFINNFLRNYNLAKQNKIIIEKLDDLNYIVPNDKFAIICMNYPRYAFGNSKLGKIDSKCQNISSKKKIEIINVITINDFLIFISKYKL